VESELCSSTSPLHWKLIARPYNKLGSEMYVEYLLFYVYFIIIIFGDEVSWDLFILPG
jgi:hypothetical protein